MDEQRILESLVTLERVADMIKTINDHLDWTDRCDNDKVSVLCSQTADALETAKYRVYEAQEVLRLWYLEQREKARA